VRCFAFALLAALLAGAACAEEPPILPPGFGASAGSNGRGGSDGSGGSSAGTGPGAGSGGGSAAGSATGGSSSGSDASQDAPDVDASTIEDASGGDAAASDAHGSDSETGAADSVVGEPIPQPAPVGCVTAVTAGAHHFTCDGLEFDVSVPDACVTRSCGLIVDVHGGTMSGPMEDKNTNLAALGKRHGYIVVTPTAFANLWNYAVDDAKVLSFLKATRDAFHVNPKRIHMTGMSQGGYMSWRFLCQHTELFGSVAPAAAAGAAAISIEVGCTFTGQDVPKGEVDILYMHGIEDGLVNFQNAVTLRDAVIAHYRMTAGQVVATDSTHKRTRYATASGRVFEFIEHRYLSDSSVLGVAIRGHCFPGSPDQTITLPGQLMAFGCKPPNSFTWGEEVVRFFMAHPKP
jgi:dienelactone hydrolase